MCYFFDWFDFRVLLAFLAVVFDGVFFAGSFAGVFFGAAPST
jgi:hypothetical protein